MRRMVGVLLLLAGLSAPMAAQQDTVVSRVSSDTAVTPTDSVVVDSVPITETRLDTLGWRLTYQVTPGSRVVTDLWRFVITSLLCVGCVPADSVPTAPPADSVPAPEPPRDTIPTPLPPPTGGAGLSLDFNDPANLGVTCPANPCSWPYRKHDYVPTGGINGTGAINSHWFTGMSIGFSPVWITVPMARHFKIRYVVKQSAPADGEGSSRKLMRLRSGPGELIGTLFFRNGFFVWYWEGWAPNVGFARFGPPEHPDNQWHTYELELDYWDINNMSVTFWFDGVLTKTITMASVNGDLITGNQPLIISPFLEMYSCGQAPACSVSINVGNYTVDDFTYTALP